MKPSLTLCSLSIAAALVSAVPAQASTVFGDAGDSSLAATPVSLTSSVGFIRGSQVFSDSFDITSAGTLTISLASVPWLDVVKNLNCFVTAPGGGIIGNAQNGVFDSVQVQPGALSVNWSGQANGPLSLGAYSISVNFTSATLPVPLPPAAMLLLSGLAALGLAFRHSRWTDLPGR